MYVRTLRRGAAPLARGQSGSVGPDGAESVILVQRVYEYIPYGYRYPTIDFLDSALSSDP